MDFNFLKEIDYSLLKILDNVNNEIKIHSSFTIVSIQSFCEFILKYVNKKEKIILRDKLSLGDFLFSDKLKVLLEKDLGVNILQLSRINNFANDCKHNGVNAFDKKEIEISYRFIFDISKKIYKYYVNSNFNDKYNSEFFDDLFTCFEKEKEIIEKSLGDQFKKKALEIENNLKEALQDKLILEKRVLESENEADELQLRISKLSNLETKYNTAEVEINRLRDLKAQLEQQVNETNIEQKEKYENEIKKLKLENFNIIEEINKLKNNDTIDKIAKIDRDKKLLREKELEIEQLKEKLNEKQQKDDSNYYDFYGKSVRQLKFSNSYEKDDTFYVIKNVSGNVKSASIYKSFYAVLNNYLQRGFVVNKSDYLEKLNLDERDYKTIIRLQMMLLSLIRNNILSDNNWNINYINGDLKLLEYAIEDIFQWIKILISLSKEEFVEPKLNLINKEFDEKYTNVKYDNTICFDSNIYSIDDYVTEIEEKNYNDFLSIWIEDSIKYSINNNKKEILLKIVKNSFGYNNFNEGQFDIIANTLNGNSTIGILPTGGGKSLIYQFTSLLQPKISIVVAPINSLIKDQIDNLSKRFGIIRCLNLTSDNRNRLDDEKKFRSANAMFVFTSPERFQNTIFRNIMLKLSDNNTIERVVLDEVHCLSEWGHDFRIPYLMLAVTLKKYCGSKIKYLGLTATASSNVIKDLKIELNILDKDIVFLKKLRRKNLRFNFKNYDDQNSYKMGLKEAIENCNPILNGENTNSIIVFARTKRGRSVSSIDSILGFLKPLYSNEIARFDGENKESQDDFIQNKKSLLIATKAFGMGIDKPNIRSTIHFGIPSSLENFYQEAGRAGRDNKEANCYLFTYKPGNEQKEYVSKFMDPRTNVLELKNIQSKTAYSDLDLSSNFWFMCNDLETPEEEANKTMQILDELINNSNNNLVYVFDNKWSKEKYLYVLHKIGIVNNWEKVYMVNDQGQFIVTLNSEHKDIEYIKSEAKKYVSQYSNSKETLEKLEEIYVFNQLREMIVIIRDWYYNNFIQSRRNQLANIYEKVQMLSNKDCSEDIQNEIDNYFDLSNTIDEAKEGYSLTFESESISEIIRYVVDLDEEVIKKRAIEMERILESVTNQNINLYTSLVFLRNNSFDLRNGLQRFDGMITQMNSTEKVELYENIAKLLFLKLNENQKEIILKYLYYKDRLLFRNVFLENISDKSLKKYYVPYINEILEMII